MMDYKKLTPMQRDALQEIGNIGSGNAATALSQMLNGKVAMNSPSFDIMDFTELSDMFNGAENVVVGVMLLLEGDIVGSMMFILSLDAANYLIGKIMAKERKSGEPFNEMELSVLEEIGNIISGAYLSSISQMTGLLINVSIPHLVVDMAGAVLSIPVIEFGMTGDKALLIGSQICDEERDLDGYFILVPSLESYEVIMRELGVAGE